MILQKCIRKILTFTLKYFMQLFQIFKIKF